MQLTAIELENFKGVGQRQTIPVAPITLLFGANSAGKSTVLHAMEYARQLLTYSTGQSSTTLEKPLEPASLPLGSFASLVHKNDLTKRIRLKFTMAVDNNDRSDYFPQNFGFDEPRALLRRWSANPADTDHLFISYLIGGAHFFDLREHALPESLVTRVESCAVELEITSRPGETTPIITRYAVDVGGQPFAAIEGYHYILGPHRQPNSKLVSLTPSHPLFHDFRKNPTEGGQGFLTYFEEWIKSVYGRIENPHDERQSGGQDGEETLADWSSETATESNDDVAARLGFSLTQLSQRHALPDLDDKLQFWELSTHVSRPYDHDPTVSGFWPFQEQAKLNALLDELIMGPARLLKRILTDLIHIGPLRELPREPFVPLQIPDRARWRTGLAAWDLLYSAPRYRYELRGQDVLSRSNRWLSDASRLDVGCTVEATDVREFSGDSPFGQLFSRPLTAADLGSVADEYNRLPSRTTLHLRDTRNGAEMAVSAAGVGVAQIVPIIVAMCKDDSPPLFVEQPELHLHPSVQVRLGDLFASISTRGRNFGQGPWSAEPKPYNRRNDRRFLMVETHSEHMLLRLLRRIRETSSNHQLPDTICGLTPEEVSVVYVEATELGTQYSAIRLNPSGEFMDRWPHGFFEERIDEMF